MIVVRFDRFVQKHESGYINQQFWNSGSCDLCGLGINGTAGLEWGSHIINEWLHRRLTNSDHFRKSSETCTWIRFADFCWIFSDFFQKHEISENISILPYDVLIFSRLKNCNSESLYNETLNNNLSWNSAYMGTRSVVEGIWKYSRNNHVSAFKVLNSLSDTMPSTTDLLSRMDAPFVTQNSD